MKGRNRRHLVVNRPPPKTGVLPVMAQNKDSINSSCFQDHSLSLVLVSGAERGGEAWRRQALFEGGYPYPRGLAQEAGTHSPCDFHFELCGRIAQNRTKTEGRRNRSLPKCTRCMY